jgi:UDP-N-acetylglucosamine acyltransferase
MKDIHPTAIVHKSANLADGVVIGPYCVVEKNVTIGEKTFLDAHVIIGKDVAIGKNNRFFPHSVIGRPPQLLGLKPGTKVGGLTIGNNNTFREFVTIHPSMHAGEWTRIGNDNFIMVGAHIGHDCTIEDKIVMSNGCQISGHCNIKTGVWLSGMVGVHQFVTVGKWVYAAGFSGINHDVPPFLIISGMYPPLVRGVNKRGLSRAGLNDEQKENIIAAFKKLYRSGGTLLGKAEALAAQDGLDENVRAMTDAIINSTKHRFGRHLEQFRH